MIRPAALVAAVVVAIVIMIDCGGNVPRDLFTWGGGGGSGDGSGGAGGI